MSNKKRRVYLLDSDQTASKQARSILENSGYEISLFRQVDQLRASLDQNYPDLFIVNPFFDHDEGVKFLFWRKKDDHLIKIPVIAALADHKESIISQLQAIGVEDHFLKPINAKHLLNLCRRILSKESIKVFRFDQAQELVATVPIHFTKISETTIQAECAVKLTDDLDGHYRVHCTELEEKGIVDEALSLTKNTTFVSDNGYFRAFFRMKGLREETLQLIRSGHFNDK